MPHLWPEIFGIKTVWHPLYIKTPKPQNRSNRPRSKSRTDCTSRYMYLEPEGLWTVPGTLTSGRWSKEEEHLHINELELLAALFSLKAFLKHTRDVSVTEEWQCNNGFLHKSSWRHKITNSSEYSKTLSLQRGITLRAQHLHVPRKENLKADFMSRHLRDRTDWVLTQPYSTSSIRHVAHF